MKIAFANPPFLKNYSRGQRSPGVPKGKTLYYPYFLAYAALWAQKQGNEVRLYDFVAENKDFKEAIKELKRDEADLIVVETSTPSIENDIRFAQRIKRNLKKVFVLLVGTHPSALSEQTLKKAGKEIDGIAVGEYDQTIVELASALAAGKPLYLVDGLVFWQKNKIIANKPRKPIENLDEFPFAGEIYKEYLNPKNYYFSAADWPMMMIITGRGCPFGCSFCVYPQVMHGFKYRYRSAQNVAAEFEYIEKNFPEIKEVVIEDDTFTTNLDRVRDICQRLIRQGNKLKWSANVRVSLDFETMKLMKEAGCRLLIVGYESGSQKLLDNMGKNIRLEDSQSFSKNAKKAGLLVHGCFMVGNPGETKETMKETLKFAKKLEPDSAQFYPVYVYPGTKSYDWFKKRGYLKKKSFSEWLTKEGKHNCVIDLPGLSAEEMMSFCHRAYLSFHLRPKYLLKKIWQLIKNPNEGKRSLRSGWRFLTNYI